MMRRLLGPTAARPQREKEYSVPLNRTLSPTTVTQDVLTILASSYFRLLPCCPF